MLLQADELAEPFRRQPPAPFRIAPPGPRTAARCVDQHHVALVVEVGQLFGFPPAIEQTHLNRRASPRRSRRQLGKTGTIRIAGNDFRFRCLSGQRQAFAARSRAQVENLHSSRSSTRQRDKLTALILYLNEAFGERRMIVDPCVGR